MEMSLLNLLFVAVPYLLQVIANSVAFDTSLARRLGEPGGFESPRGVVGVRHGRHGAPGATGIKCGTTGRRRCTSPRLRSSPFPTPKAQTWPRPEGTAPYLRRASFDPPIGVAGPVRRPSSRRVQVSQTCR